MPVAARRRPESTAVIPAQAGIQEGEAVVLG